MFTAVRTVDVLSLMKLTLTHVESFFDMVEVIV
jgi:hypothetical protein